MIRVLDMKYNIFFYLNSSFMTFSSRIRFFPDRIRILADPDLDSEKKADPDPGEQNPDPKHWMI